MTGDAEGSEANRLLFPYFRGEKTNTTGGGELIARDSRMEAVEIYWISEGALLTGIRAIWGPNYGATSFSFAVFPGLLQGFPIRREVQQPSNDRKPL